MCLYYTIVRLPAAEEPEQRTRDRNFNRKLIRPASVRLLFRFSFDSLRLPFRVGVSLTGKPLAAALAVNGEFFANVMPHLPRKRFLMSDLLSLLIARALLTGK